MNVLRLHALVGPHNWHHLDERAHHLCGPVRGLLRAHCARFPLRERNAARARRLCYGEYRARRHERRIFLDSRPVAARNQPLTHLRLILQGTNSTPSFYDRNKSTLRVPPSDLASPTMHPLLRPNLYTFKEPRNRLRQATLAGGIDSLESISGLLNHLKFGLWQHRSL